ncbi:hypothetical protein A4H97_10695 [Niastella yeongjuensis]|uniref:Uncharacterized protein n=1 Tax=Niastella yeongjuensis TaxID=354355 RepID=A0A1V9EFJ5_9BACT|nr:hypothetical protein [Niastella yeongjuensis]OQP44821.1 hypothetical protein A4H97_10695 [Niastella yeongjuensis]SEP42196.1 hypothetical protein SAMN05660816_05959 [Niastella yeongjuensis]
MYLWAGFYKTGSSNVEEALHRLGLGNYRSTSQKFGFFYTFRNMNDNNLFATMTANNYLMITDINYSIIANHTKEINPLLRELELIKNFQVEEFMKIYYENNSNIEAFARGRNGLLEQFVYTAADSRMSYELAKYGNEDEENPFETINPFEEVCETIENITEKVFGKKIYSEFGDLQEFELEQFIKS